MRPRQLLLTFMAFSVVLVALVGVAARRQAPGIAGYGFYAVLGCWMVVVTWNASDWFALCPHRLVRLAARIVAVIGWAALGTFVWFVLLMNAAESFGLPH